MKWCMVIIRGLAGQFLIDWKFRKPFFLGTEGLWTRHVLEHIGAEAW
jgi:hypothetical protein